MTKQLRQEVIDELKLKIELHLDHSFGIMPENASQKQMYDSVATAIKHILQEKRKIFNHQEREQKKKKIYYLCMEFLLGRSLKTNIYNLGIQNEVREVCKKYGFILEDLYDNENDAGLGNGGLGRLAACYMDSLASLQYPAMGFSIRYEYGLFKQVIIDGWQTEMPDIWLPGGEVWLTPRPDKNCIVKFGGKMVEVDKGNHRLEFDQVGASEVEAIAYDMFISGGAESKGVSCLRLWRARNIHNFSMNHFSQGDYMRAMQADNEAKLISKVLYPSDDHLEGKSLRLKQQYFLVSASVNSIFRDVLKKTDNIRNFADYAEIHINDTHPTLVIPELMRILMDDYNLDWDEAWEIVGKCTAYTNHTVLAEALECWSTDLVSSLLPRIWQILCEIDKRYRGFAQFKGLDKETINKTAVIDYGAVKMANLCCIATSKVNGVSQLHSDILTKTIFKDYYKMMPEKFTNVTNGIAHRRWLCYSNPRLSSLLDETIGDDYKTNPPTLKNFEKFKDDQNVLEQLAQIKYKNKVDFADYVKKSQGIIIDPTSRFDVQVKRLHEYKRQLLNALKIIDLMNQLDENPNLDMPKQTFIFGAKAAPSYQKAKEIIQLICMIGKEIDATPHMRDKIKVTFLENYCVTMAEKLMPAAEVSEQISTAGKEASGTGNMKFMINGAITLGTLDGANVEMSQSVGKDNIFIFGMNSRQVGDLWNLGYNSFEYFQSNSKIERIIQRLNAGIGGVSFAHIAEYLIGGEGIADPYMCLADFESYLTAVRNLGEAYDDKNRWNKMSLMNIANAGRFAADRAIREYANNIWHLNPLEV